MSLSITRLFGWWEASIVIVILLVLSATRKRFLRGTKTTALKGPANQSFIFGLYGHINQAEDPGSLYEQWSKEYGPAYIVPMGFGSNRIIICDPKANAHFLSKETFGYVQTNLSKIFIENLFGRGLLWAEGESHKRQRKALSPAFSNVAIRRMTSLFYDSSYKLVASWDSELDSASNAEAVIDVQQWMNRVSLDSIGIAGFGHDFQTLDGKHSPVTDVFDSFGGAHGGLVSRIVFLLGPMLPFLQRLPTKQNRTLKRMRSVMREIADELLFQTKKEKEGSQLSEEKSEDKSIIGLLVKAESTDSSLQMSKDEILAQNVLLLAGYETTSISLTWALIELSRNQDKQQRLRDELAQFTSTDPSWDQLASGLPYLDSIVHEILRLYPPVRETTRMAAEDDIMPFEKPVIDASGQAVTSLVIAKGTVITSPTQCINRSEAFWGPDAKEFKPERWLSDDGLFQAKDIQGHRHILTFSDGPRICLGKSLALAEFKAVLSVLIRNYTFEFPDGPKTKIVKHPSILPRPKVEGEEGPKLPLRVKRVEG